MALLFVLGRLAPYVVTAGVALIWLDLLQPPARRRLATDLPSIILGLLLTAWALLYWGSRLASPPHEVAVAARYVRMALLAPSLVAGIFVVRPPSGDLRLAARLSARGELGRAEAAYRRVLSSGRRGEVPWAALGLARVLLLNGDLDGACALLQRVIDSGEQRAVARAALNLGLLRHRQGDEQRARAAYERVIAIRGARQAGKAALQLGSLLHGRGDTAGARAAYRLAIKRGPRETREAAVRALHTLEAAARRG